MLLVPLLLLITSLREPELYILYTLPRSIYKYTHAMHAQKSLHNVSQVVANFKNVFITFLFSRSYRIFFYICTEWESMVFLGGCWKDMKENEERNVNPAHARIMANFYSPLIKRRKILINSNLFIFIWLMWSFFLLLQTRA